MHPLIHAWVPRATLRRAVERHVQGFLSLVDNDEFATGLRIAMPLPGVATSAYRIRMLEIGPDQQVIAGIRFRPDPAMAFVDVYARNFAIASRSQVSALRETMLDCFKIFGPGCVRISTAVDSPEEAVLAGFPGSTDFLTVAAPVSQLQRQPPPAHLERIHLRQSSCQESFDRYSRAFDAFHASVPQLKHAVPRASRSALEQCASDGMLYNVEVDRKWAGVIAGRLQTDFGMNGVRIVKEILTGPYRSRGLGPALQRRFIDLLPNGAGNMLHGAIHPANLASLKTAMRVGRRPVMRTMFLAP
jgi:hypothetical protein